MKTLTLILLAGIAAGFTALAQPDGKIEPPPGVPHPDQVTLTQKPVRVDWSQLPPAATNAAVTFANDIAPIFKESCVRCHGAQKPKAGLRLDTLQGVLDGTSDGAILKAGDSANSLLVKAVSQLDPKTAMPPKPRASRMAGGDGGRPPAASFGTNAPGTNASGPRPRSFGPPAKPLTAEQVGLVRAWIDQGAK